MKRAILAGHRTMFKLLYLTWSTPSIFVFLKDSLALAMKFWVSSHFMSPLMPINACCASMCRCCACVYSGIWD